VSLAEAFHLEEEGTSGHQKGRQPRRVVRHSTLGNPIGCNSPKHSFSENKELPDTRKEVSIEAL
jgi:hypothetical protein